jgi:hypothetical protein
MDGESGACVAASRTCVPEERENAGLPRSVERESAGGSDGNAMRPDHCSGPDGRPSRFIDPRIWEREACTMWPVSHLTTLVQLSGDRSARLTFESEGHRAASKVNNLSLNLTKPGGHVNDV